MAMADRRIDQLKDFEDTQAGVKGIVDSGITKLPEIFIHENNKDIEKYSCSINKCIPVIDLEGANHEKKVNQILYASENWGFFQVINHGIPLSVMDDMVKSIRMFHEQDSELKRPFYTRDNSRTVVYHSNIDLYYSKAAVWKDSITFKMVPPPTNPEQIPTICRKITTEYSEQILRLGCNLLRLLSEALGLKKTKLEEMGCSEGVVIKGHYYPPCPEPELTFGTADHTDNDFLTILLQDEVGGLQVWYEEEHEWVNVPPLPAALIINLGDLLQLITNDKFKSVHHRVLAKKEGPRISVASFFRPHCGEGFTSRLYEPIKELIMVSDSDSEESSRRQLIYRGTTVESYTNCFISNAMNGTVALSHFKLL